MLSASPSNRSPSVGLAVVDSMGPTRIKGHRPAATALFPHGAPDHPTAVFRKKRGKAGRYRPYHETCRQSIRRDVREVSGVEGESMRKKLSGICSVLFSLVRSNPA